MLEKLGVQTFTVRKYTKTPKELEMTLLKLYDLGFSQFELARINFDEEECQVLEKLKKEYGFVYTTCQIKLKTILKTFDWIIEFSKRLDIKTLEVSVIPIWAFRQRKIGLLKLAKVLNELGSRSQKHNIELLYHHHNFELIKMGDTLGIELLIKNLDCEKVNLVVDTYWLARSGINPHEFIQKYEHRIRGVHLRDSELIFKTLGFKFRDQIIGDGTIDFRPFKEEYKTISFYSIEQDSETPFKALEKSFSYLQSL